MDTKTKQSPNQTQSIKPGSKRLHIQNSNTIIFISIITASVIVAISLVLISFLFKQYQYNQKTIREETATLKVLESNQSNLENLKTTRSSLNTSNMNEHKIFNAMPPIYDYPALVSAMDKLASDSGVSLQGSIGSDDSGSAGSPSNNPQRIEIPLTMQVSGSYASVREYIRNLELSIRPITVKSVELSGSNDSLEANISAITYYQPSKVLTTDTKEIQ